MTGPPLDPPPAGDRDPAATAAPGAAGDRDPAGASPGAGELSYEQAAARIEAIIRRLDSGEAGLRETLDLVREGRELVELCAAELEAVGRGLEELQLDELIARLDGARPARDIEPGRSTEDDPRRPSG